LWQENDEPDKLASIKPQQPQHCTAVYPAMRKPKPGYRRFYTGEPGRTERNEGAVEIRTLLRADKGNCRRPHSAAGCFASHRFNWGSLVAKRATSHEKHSSASMIHFILFNLRRGLRLCRNVSGILSIANRPARWSGPGSSPPQSRCSS
jgi:hypothetical protein